MVALVLVGSFGSLATAGGTHSALVASGAGSSVGIVGVGAPAVASRSGSGPVGGSVAPAFSSPPVPSNPGAAAASRVLSATRAAGVPSNLVYVPRPSVSAARLDAAKAGDLVSPSYNASPAPMGLAYYGLSAGPSNSTVATVLNTTRILATVTTNATGVQPLDLVQANPDGYGIQLNAVLTDVTLFGHHGYSFWTQNVVAYYPDTQLMTIVTNVWNFSSSSALMTQNALRYNGISGSASDGPNGTNSVGSLGFYYGERVISTPISYPFTLSLYLNSTIIDHRDAVDFGIRLSGTGEGFASSAWDYVVFNSIRASGAPVSRPANYTANGFAYNPMGVPDDFEVTVGGPGSGSQATLFAADATLGLAYYAGSRFVSVPSAFSYGGETGETATGANVAWSNAPGGPSGLSTYGTMTTGPSVLTGLWNATGAKGSFPLTIASNPLNAISILTPTGAAPTFTVEQPSVAPGGFTRTFYLAPGHYSIVTELSGYASATHAIDLTAPTTLYVNLTADAALGVYTPLWAFSNAAVGALAVSGNGTAANPYVMPSLQPTAIGSTFGIYNEYGFPAYPAVLFYRTSVPVEFARPPPFTTTTDTAAGAGTYLPATNDPPYWFWGASNVSIVSAGGISGWFAENAFIPTLFNAFNVVFYEGGHNLVANSTFDSEAQGLLLYSGGTFFGPAKVGGGNNTVWGNTFEERSPPSARFPLLSSSLAVGLMVAESNDLIYNNKFLSPITAWQLPIDLYTGAPELFTNSWNVARQPASNVNHASGFPFEPLTGSILGTSYQGGNFWWDYGDAARGNPYGVLPYHENLTTLLPSLLGGPVYHASYIYPGGDSVPLLPFTLYPLTVEATPASPGSVWGAKISNATELLANFTTGASSEVVYLPNGSYSYAGLSSPGYLYTGPTPGSLTIAGSSATLALPFSSVQTYPVMFVPRVVVAGATWGAEILNKATLLFSNFTTGATSRVLNLPNGTYAFRAIGTANLLIPPRKAGGFKVDGHERFVVLPFHGPSGFRSLVFHARGLPRFTAWSVRVNGTSAVGYPYNLTAVTERKAILFALPAGSYDYRVTGLPGYAVSPAKGVVTLPSSSNVAVHLKFKVYSYRVTFTESGLPAGTAWAVKVGKEGRHASVPSLVFSLPNGSYTFSIRPKAGWNTTYRGSFTVNGTTVSLPVVFSPYTYALTFDESGLASGTNWSVTVGSTTHVASAPNPIVFAEKNGSYAYSVGVVTGFAASPSSGTIGVAGHGVVQAIAFAAAPVAVPLSPLGRSPLAFALPRQD